MRRGMILQSDDSKTSEAINDHSEKNDFRSLAFLCNVWGPKRKRKDDSADELEVVHPRRGFEFSRGKVPMKTT
jgi:hypothetical protein